MNRWALRAVAYSVIASLLALVVGLVSATTTTNSTAFAYDGPIDHAGRRS
jgi:hypothetical protein